MKRYGATTVKNELNYNNQTTVKKLEKQSVKFEPVKGILVRSGCYLNKLELIKTFGIEGFNKLKKRLYLRTIVDPKRNKICTANLMENHAATGCVIIPRFVAFNWEKEGYITVENKMVYNFHHIPDKIHQERGNNLASSIQSSDDRGNWEDPPAGITQLVQGKWEDTITSSNNQNVVLNYMYKHIYTEENRIKGKAGCVLHLAAGQGKTFVMAKLISHIKGKTVVAVPNETLLNQTEVVLRNAFPNLKIGAYYNKRKEVGDITLMIIDSMYMPETYTFVDLNDVEEIDTNTYVEKLKSYKTKCAALKYIKKITESEDSDLINDIYNNPEKLKPHIKNIPTNIKKVKKELSANDYFKQFKIAIFDEIHIYCSKTCRVALKRAQAPYMLGLTASPNERIDKFDEIARMFVGPLLNAKLLPGYEASDFNFTSSYYPIIYNAPPEYSEQQEMYHNVLEQLRVDPYRTQLIVNLIKQAIDEKSYTFVFTERRKHVIGIKKVLDKLGINTDMPEFSFDTPSECPGEEEFRPDFQSENNELEELEEYRSDSQNEYYEEDIDINQNDNIVTELEDYDDDDIVTEDYDDAIVTEQDENKLCSILMGGATVEQENHAEHKAMVILATTAYLGTGRSIPKCNRIIMAMPRKSKILQILGRIFRLSGDASIHRKIYDIVDNKSCVRRQYSIRKNVAQTEYQSIIEAKQIYDYDDIKLDIELEEYKQLIL
jgi:superfamily II DNA or RNA helicase